MSPNESILGADDPAGPLFPISQRKLPWQPILWRKKRKLYSFVALAHVSVNGASISCENFVKFGPVTPELIELICEPLVRHGKKTGVFSQIFPDALDRFLQFFHHMKALWVQTMALYFIFHDNQIMLGKVWTYTDTTCILCTSFRKRIGISLSTVCANKKQSIRKNAIFQRW